MHALLDMLARPEGIEPPSPWVRSPVLCPLSYGRLPTPIVAQTFSNLSKQVRCVPPGCSVVLQDASIDPIGFDTYTEREMHPFG